MKGGRHRDPRPRWEHICRMSVGPRAGAPATSWVVPVSEGRDYHHTYVGALLSVVKHNRLLRAIQRDSLIPSVVMRAEVRRTPPPKGRP